MATAITVTQSTCTTHFLELMLHYKKPSFIHFLDRRFAQDTTRMLLIVPFSFVANPKNFHTWLLAPDRGFSHTSAMSGSAKAHCLMFKVLHADKQKWWMVMHMSNNHVLNYEPIDIDICKAPNCYHDIGIHIDVSVCRYVSHIPITVQHCVTTVCRLHSVHIL